MHVGMQSGTNAKIQNQNALSRASTYVYVCMYPCIQSVQRCKIGYALKTAWYICTFTHDDWKTYFKSHCVSSTKFLQFALAATMMFHLMSGQTLSALFCSYTAWLEKNAVLLLRSVWSNPLVDRRKLYSPIPSSWSVSHSERVVFPFRGLLSRGPRESWAVARERMGISSNFPQKSWRRR